MDIKSQTKKREKLSDQLYDQLLEKIVAGELTEGDKLPSENEIAKAFNVSRPVIREAVLRLQAEGLVYTRQGAGSFVKVRPPENVSDFTSPTGIPELLRCFEARLPIEGATAALAAQRATKDDLKAIEAALLDMEEAMDQGSIADKADFEFHLAIANATGNEFHVAILKTLHAATRSGMRITLKLTKLDSRECLKRVKEEHRAIYDAIAHGDISAADIAMRHHLQSARNRVIIYQRDV